MLNFASFIIDESLRKLLQPLTDDQKEGLKNSIRSIGITDPIIIWKNDGKQIIVDGIDRFEIAKDLGIIDIPSKPLDFHNIAAAAKWRIERHQNRRQMNAFNSIEAALLLFEGQLSEQAKQNQLQGRQLSEASSDVQVWVNEEIAAIAQSNSNYVSKVRNLLKDVKKNENIIDELRQGKRHISSLNAKIKFEKIDLDDDNDLTAPPTDNEPETNDAVVGPLVKRYNEGQFIPRDFDKQQSYATLEPQYRRKGPATVGIPYVIASVKPSLKNNDVISLTAVVVKLWESAYRRGFIEGRKDRELVVDDYFKRRTKELKKDFVEFLAKEEGHLQIANEPLGE